MSIKFKRITLKNFLSYGNAPTVVELDRPGTTTFIVGEDKDDTSAGIKGNGVGKTTILNALVFAIYNKPVSNISMENLVNNVNKKGMEVMVQFEKDDKDWAIRRIRKGKQGASVHLYQSWPDATDDDNTVPIDGKPYKDITPDSIKLTTQMIEKIMGVPYELFVRIVGFSANHRPFLDLPNTHASQANQKDIIEELFEMTVLTERAEALKQKIKDTNADLKLQTAHIAQLREEHARHHKLVEATKTRMNEWKGQNEEEKASILKKLEKVEGIDIEEQHKLHDKLGSITSAMVNHGRNIKRIEDEIKDHALNKIKAEQELEHLLKAECPYCKQTYKDNEMKIIDREAYISDRDFDIEKLGDELTKEDAQVEQLQTEREAVEKQIVVNNIKELMDIRSKQAQYNDRLKHIDTEENPHIAVLKELEDFDLEDIDNSKAEDLEDDLLHQDFLLKGLHQKGSFIRKKLLNKKVPFLNQRLAKYLDILGLPHTVRFTEAMTVDITRFGRKLDFGNLSNGQQARLNFALSLAFRDMLEKVHGTINVYMLDEVLDVGLDAIGISAAARLLKSKARDDGLSVYIISHKDELSNAFDSKMTITMNKGFSYIEE